MRLMKKFFFFILILIILSIFVIFALCLWFEYDNGDDPFWYQFTKDYEEDKKRKIEQFYLHCTNVYGLIYCKKSYYNQINNLSEGQLAILL
ncbi:hypothetical protein Gromo_00255 [Candidatus Gromoviella agglomerans]|nr:hypothetical protein Gromo_00255 [Candidatus Gromoviella agglomerans]